MKNKGLLMILLLGLTTSISACDMFQPVKRNKDEDSGNATIYYLTRTYVDEPDQYYSSHAQEPTPTVLKFDYKAMKTYYYTADDILGENAPMYGYHESYVEYGKLTVAIEVEDGMITQYYLKFNKDGTAVMSKEKAQSTINGEEGTLPNVSSKEMSSPAILDLGFEFSINEHTINPDCLFPETYFYCEINYAISQNYTIRDYN